MGRQRKWDAESYENVERNQINYRPTSVQLALFEQAKRVNLNANQIIDIVFLSNSLTQVLKQNLSIGRTKRQDVTGDIIPFQPYNDCRILVQWMTEENISVSQVINDLLDINMTALLQMIDKRKRALDKFSIIVKSFVS